MLNHTDFFRGVRVAEVIAIKPAAGDIQVGKKAIRLYCHQASCWWDLQIRAHRKLESGAEGKDFLLANATLSLEDLVALRDAINTLLREAEPSAEERTAPIEAESMTVQQALECGILSADQGEGVKDPRGGKWVRQGDKYFRLTA